MMRCITQRPGHRADDPIIRFDHAEEPAARAGIESGYSKVAPDLALAVRVEFLGRAREKGRTFRSTATGR
jgi:hypothetical protein